jgi:hypothetical protein
LNGSNGTIFAYGQVRVSVRDRFRVSVRDRFRISVRDRLRVIVSKGYNGTILMIDRLVLWLALGIG